MLCTTSFDVKTQGRSDVGVMNAQIKATRRNNLGRRSARIRCNATQAAGELHAAEESPA